MCWLPLILTAIVPGASIDALAKASETVIQVGHTRLRLQSLSPTLLRLEQEGPEHFEDRTTFTVRERSWPGDPITGQETLPGGGVLVRTGHSQVELSPGPSAASPAVRLRSPEGQQRWAIPTLASAPTGLKAPPPAEVEENTVLAIADSPRFVPAAAGAVPPQKPLPKHLANTSGYDVGNHAVDVYIFTAWKGYASMRAEFLRLTGATPLLPAWAFGLWFSWYHPYSQAEKEAEVQHFLDDGLGLSVVSLDKDWREEYQPWMNKTGFPYSVNTTLFPDMDGFFNFVHERHLWVFFNDHPKPLRSGPAGTSSSNPEVVLAPEEVSFRYNGLTSLLARGLDFWWDDCHWRWFEPALAVPPASAKVDGIAWGEAVFHDIEAFYDERHRSNNTVPLLLSCAESSHPAAHRYPVWWTGDIFSTNLMSSVADMIRGGYETFKPYVHPDCTGHHNPNPPEVYVRWIQFCAFGTVMRVHSDPWNDRRPWTLGPEVEDLFRDFVQTRIRLLPTFVSASARAAADGEPLVKRLDFAWPKEMNATRMDQFLLANSTLVAPVDPFPWNSTSAKPPFFNRSRTVWIPPGEWTHAFTGDTLRGPQSLQVVSSLPEMPLYHRRGRLVITADSASRPAEVDWQRLVLQVWPHSRQELALAQPGVERSCTEVLVDSETARPSALSTTLEMRQSYNPSQDACGEGAVATSRRLQLLIFPEGVSLGATWPVVPERSRAWLVRLHLLPGEVMTCAFLDGQPLPRNSTREVAAQRRGGRVHPFGGAGAAAPWPVVELEMGEAPAGQARALTLGISEGSLPPLVV